MAARRAHAAAAVAAAANPWQRWVAACNRGDRAAAGLLPFTIAGEVGGYVRPAFAGELRAFPEAFEVAAGEVRVARHLQDPAARTEAVAAALGALRAEGKIPGWRGELYPCAAGFGAEPFLLLERAAAPFFGLKAYGVHVCAFVVGADGRERMWVARRSRTKQTSPGKLDHLVAGGQPFGVAPGANVVKECGEEANVPPDLARRAVAASAVSYEYLVDETDSAWGGASGLKRDVLFCYDLQLPESFEPRNNDGEVEDFMLWDIEKVMATIAETDEFKLNCNLVIIDFLVRHGHLTPDNTPGYLDLVAGLRRGECS